MTKATKATAAVITLMMTLSAPRVMAQTPLTLPVDTTKIIEEVVEEATFLQLPDTITQPRRVKAQPVRAFFDYNDKIEDVVVGTDTVSVILPRYNMGRYDRGLFNYLFIPKGQWSFGLTASYGEFSTEDVQILSLLKDLNFKGKMYSVSPSVSYFFRNNQSVGMRFNFNRGIGELGKLSVDIDEDMNFSLRDVSYHSQDLGLAIFYRNYIGLSSLKRFGIFNEVEIAFNNGTKTFSRLYDGKPKETRTITTGAALNFSPGVTMYIMDYVSFNVAIGVFGFNLQQERQTTNNVDEGKRFTTGANFKFNLFNIKFGVSVTI